MIEEWRPVKGWEGVYSVSNLGRIRSESRFVKSGNPAGRTPRVRIMHQATKKTGHKTIMCHDGARRQRLHVHRMVMLAFTDGPPTPLHEVAHNDGNATNNVISNLRWATRSENHRDKLAHGTHNRGDRHPNMKLTNAQVHEIRKASGTCQQIAEKYGVTFQHIAAIRAGKARQTT